MPKKCKSCRHHGTLTFTALDRVRAVEICKNDRVLSEDERDMFPDRRGTPLDLALNRCFTDTGRDDDFHIYFEPRDPETGAAVAMAKAA